MDFSIIIVNYNLSHEVKNCINSLVDLPKSSNFEVILIDNHSHDKTILDIAKNFSLNLKFKFTFIRTETNLGFGKACNLAVQNASAPILFFLNPDTIIKDDIFEKVSHSLKNDNKIGIVGINVNENKIMDFSAGYFPNYTLELLNIISLGRIVEALYMRLRVKFTKAKILNVEWVMGAALFISKELFEMVGGFDADYFLYFEEMDLCKKVLIKGNSIKYLADVKINHIGSVSSKKNYYFFTKMFYKGKLIFLKKHSASLSFTIYRYLIYLHFINQIVIQSFLKLNNKSKSEGKIKAFKRTYLIFSTIQNP